MQVPGLMNMGVALPPTVQATPATLEGVDLVVEATFSDLLFLEDDSPSTDNIGQIALVNLIATQTTPKLGARITPEVDAPISVPDASVRMEMATTGRADAALFPREPAPLGEGEFQPDLKEVSTKSGNAAGHPNEKAVDKTAAEKPATKATAKHVGDFPASSMDDIRSDAQSRLPGHGTNDKSDLGGIDMDKALATGGKDQQVERLRAPEHLVKAGPTTIATEAHTVLGQVIDGPMATGDVKVTQAKAFPVADLPLPVETAPLRADLTFLRYRIARAPVQEEPLRTEAPNSARGSDPKNSERPLVSGQETLALPPGLMSALIRTEQEDAERDLGVHLHDVAQPGNATGRVLTSTGASLSGISLPHLAANIVEKLVKGPDGTVTLTLSPEELGQVRLSFQNDGQNPDRIIVMLAFDRPDTQDLFRRHAEQLTEALRSAGYEGVQLDFGGQGHQKPSHQMAEAMVEGADLTDALAMVDPGPVATRGNPAGTATLDLRL